MKTSIYMSLRSYFSFLPRFYRLATVSVLSNMMIPLAGLCDTAFLGHLKDIRHLAGIILASILFDYLYRVLKFLRNSTNAMTAQAVGQDDATGVLLAGLRSGLIALAIALTILILQYPIEKLGFAILSGSVEVEASGIEYFNARIWGAPAVLLNFVLIGWFLGREKNHIVLIMSLLGNGSNVLFDYLMIYRWGWESLGAGLATALSQYLALLVGLIAVVASVSRKDLSQALETVLEPEALRGILTLKGNILIRFLILISTYSLFTNLSAGIGTDVLTQNGLLLQIAFLSQFTVQGVGMTAQTLIGNFKGKGDTDKMLPLMSLATINALLIASVFICASIMFPDTVFGLLTNHSEVNQGIIDYTIWLLPLLTFTASAFILEGYFIGLKEGAVLRNASLIGFCLVFSPLIIAAWYWQNVDLLWLSLTMYMVSGTFYLGIKMIQVQQNLTLAIGD